MNSNQKDDQKDKQGSPAPGARGFASMDQERQREIASQGGRAAHEKGTAHEFTSAEAREAGRKGGGSRASNDQATSNRDSDRATADQGKRDESPKNRSMKDADSRSNAGSDARDRHTEMDRPGNKR